MDKALVSQSASIDVAKHAVGFSRHWLLNNERKLSEYVPLGTICTGGTLEKKVLH